MRVFLVWVFIGILLTAAVAVGWMGQYVTAKSAGSGQVRVVIPRGVGVRTIKTLLGRKGIIKDDIRFLIMARCVPEASQLKAGEFQVPLGLTPLEVVRFLVNAKPVQYRVTIPEGWRLTQVAMAFARDGWVDTNRFLQLCEDKEFITELGLAVDSLEGYLFPETYSLAKGSVTEKTVITAMVRRFTQVWSQLDKPAGLDGSIGVENRLVIKASHYKQFADSHESLALNRHQLVTLASIVEKETAAPAERPLIAGVFYNRLRKGMRLQSDPTTIYGIKDFNGNLTRADLNRKNPYNTYVISGLPPGPICNPGRDALDAVLHPAQTGHLYFVSKNDGTHYFSATLAEHNRAVYRYQKRRNRKKTRNK